MLKHFYHEKTLKLANLIVVIIGGWFLFIMFLSIFFDW